MEQEHFGIKVFDAKLKDVKIIEPDVFEDKRGFFMESYFEEKYKKLGIDFNFVQDNHSLMGASLIQFTRGKIDEQFI